MKQPPELLEKLLELAAKEVDEQLNAHQKRVQFYSSLISAILAATVAGAMRAEEASHYFLLLVGPGLVVVLSVIAVQGTFRFYQRFLEAVTQKGKLEQALHLHEPVENENEQYWKGEPLLAIRHLDARKAFPSSQEFIHRHRHAGYQRYTRILFFAFGLSGVYLAILLIVKATTLCY